MRLSAGQWILWWAAAGLFVPILLLLNWLLLSRLTHRHVFANPELILWPSSIILMGLDGQHRVLMIVAVYAIAFVANIALYVAVGTVTWLFIVQFRRY